MAAGDVLVFLIFAFGGRETHEPDSASLIGDLIRIMIPFVVTWFVVAIPIGVLRPDVLHQPRRASAQTLIAWLIAGPLAILLRSLLLGSGVILVPFFIVTMGLNAALLLVWHGTYAWWSTRRSPA